MSWTERRTISTAGVLEFAQIQLPIRIISESNRTTHWSDRHARFKQQKAEVNAELHNLFNRKQFKLPVTVLLTRVAPRKLDDDNLRSAFKGIRDEIAAILGVDDGSDRIRFEYEQEKPDKDELKHLKYSVRITINSI